MNAVLTIVSLHEDGRTHLCNCSTIRQDTWTDVVMNAAEAVRAFSGTILSATLVRENEEPGQVILAKCFQPTEW